MNIQGKEQQTEEAATPCLLFCWLVLVWIVPSLNEISGSWPLQQGELGLDSEKEADQEHLAKHLLKSGIETGNREN